MVGVEGDDFINYFELSSFTNKYINFCICWDLCGVFLFVGGFLHWNIANHLKTEFGVNNPRYPPINCGY